MIRKIVEIIPSSIPFNGRIDKFAVIPNIPIIAGKIPAKQPGQAPAKIPKKVPIIPKSPFFPEIVFNFITLSIVRVIVVATRTGIIMKLRNANEIVNANLYAEKKFFRVMYVPFKIMFRPKKIMKERINVHSLSFIIFNVCFIIINFC